MPLRQGYPRARPGSGLGMGKLGEYQGKRRAGATNEPFGEEAASAEGSTLGGAFVVHLHDATRRHWDVRFEVSGVLASFAVPRGPSTDPGARHLAVRTEDHPLDYLDFEDVIPDGLYGAGPMILWDRGWVEYLEGPAEQGLAAGKLHVSFHGLKLRGRYALVKLDERARGPARGEGNAWLFLKKADAHASAARDIVAELPRSVLSGLAVEELAHKDAIGRDLERRAQSREGAARLVDADALLSGGLCPLAAASASEGLKAARGRGRDKSRSARPCTYDAELDGVRVLATRGGDVVSLRTWEPGGDARSIEAFYPDVVRALRALPAPRLSLDGTLVAFDASGRPSMRRLAERATRVGRGDVHHAVASTPVALLATDLLALGDTDVRGCAIELRRELLGALLPAVPAVVRAAPPLEGDLDAVRASCAALDIATVIAKPRGSTYGGGSWTALPTGAERRGPGAFDHGALGARAAGREVTVTNRSKLFWPADGLTKGDLCDYYAAIAPTLLPYLFARPIILVRYPDGIEGKSFYQWNVPAGMPPWVRTLELVDDEGRPRRGFLVDRPETLLYVANLGNIPIHILACRTPHLDRADFFTLDFDVKQSGLRHAITLARSLRELLEAAGLPGFPKTSGQTGLHVLCPLGPGQDFETARALAELFGRLLVERHPDIATMERLVKKRGAKVYVDTGQTGPSRAIVAPWSVRAVAGATVSTPLAWDEVDAGLDPRAFTMRTVPGRIAAQGDPMRPMLDARPDVGAAVARLTAMLAPSGRPDRA